MEKIDSVLKTPSNEEQENGKGTNDSAPQNLQVNSIKQLVTIEKSRLTKIGNRIIGLLRKKGCRAEIKFQRKCFTE